MLLEMIWTFFKIGLFTIGGGYAMIPLITEELVAHQWMTAAEVSDVIAIAKMTPGPFAANSATFAGMKIAGVFGALACTLGVVLPSIIITIVVAKFFFDFQNHKAVKNALKGIRPVVVALIASAIITVIKLTLIKTDSETNILTAIKNIDIYSIIILAISLYFLLVKKVHPVLLITISGILGIGFYYVLPMFS